MKTAKTMHTAAIVGILIGVNVGIAGVTFVLSLFTGESYWNWVSGVMLGATLGIVICGWETRLKGKDTEPETWRTP